MCVPNPSNPTQGGPPGQTPGPIIAPGPGQSAPTPEPSDKAGEKLYPQEQAQPEQVQPKPAQKVEAPVEPKPAPKEAAKPVKRTVTKPKNQGGGDLVV